MHKYMHEAFSLLPKALSLRFASHVVTNFHVHVIISTQFILKFTEQYPSLPRNPSVPVRRRFI